MSEEIKKPESSGIYITLDEGKFCGFALYDASYKIWGCTYQSIEEAVRKPEYEYAEQNKAWTGISADKQAEVYKCVAIWLVESIDSIAEHCDVSCEGQVLIDASRCIDVSKVVLQ